MFIVVSYYEKLVANTESEFLHALLIHTQALMLVWFQIKTKEKQKKLKREYCNQSAAQLYSTIKFDSHCARCNTEQVSVAQTLDAQAGVTFAYGVKSVY